MKNYRVLKKITEAPGVATLELELVGENISTFTAGQFITVYFPDAKTPEGKAYSISSAPGEPTFAITVRGIGEFSNRLCALRPGDSIAASLPYGYFSSIEDEAHLILIAAGIGITPFRSMVEELMMQRQSRNIVLLYSVKTPDQLVYRDVFDRAAAWQIGLKPTYIVSDHAAAKATGWTGQTGRLSASTIQTVIPDYHERMFYLSGPQAMVTAFEQTLAELGVPHSQINTDYFPGF